MNYPYADTLGRDWSTATEAKLIEHPEGDASIRLTWSDGAYLVQSCDSKEQAQDTLARLGFKPSRSAR